MLQDIDNLSPFDFTESITADITRSLVNLNNPSDERHKFVFDSLIRHLHDFIRETNVTTEEWRTTIQFLTRVGQACTPARQEFILLSDVLGISTLVDDLNNPTTGMSTASSVLGPFYIDNAPEVLRGGSIASEGKGQYMLVEGRVMTTQGEPIPGAVIDTWETDGHGQYDIQHSEGLDCRGRLRADQDGRYSFRAVVPSAYCIPADGPVGDLLLLLKRHNMRPAHIHFKIEAPGFRKLVTALYFEGDPYLESDSVFGVKRTLIVNLKEVRDENEARRHGFPISDTFKSLEFDFVLADE